MPDDEAHRREVAEEVHDEHADHDENGPAVGPGGFGIVAHDAPFTTPARRAVKKAGSPPFARIVRAATL
jgi:hypothetical protein